MRDSVTFVHTADLHLDAPFAGISADDPRVGRELADATYQAFSRVVDVCLERSADFLVIAGDAYNSADKSLRAQLRFRAQLQRLADAGIEVFLSHGNHDPLSGWSAGIELPDTVRVFPADRVARFEVMRDGDVIAAVYGRSFARAAETENFALGYSRQGDEPVAIGVLHANVGGNTDYDPYAPASLSDLRAAGLDYWALGHIHKQEVLARDPWVVYAGSPQGLNPKETGAHGCFVVTAGRGGVTDVAPVKTAAIVWAQLEVDASEAETIDDVRRALVEACATVSADVACPCVARIRLVGRSRAHADLARPGLLGELAEDLRDEQAARAPWLWLDRLDDRTSRILDVAELRESADFSGELVRASDGLSTDPGQLAAVVSGLSAPLAATLSGYSPGLSDAELLAAARDSALDLLVPEGGDGR